jgi:hypothetical protein
MLLSGALGDFIFALDLAYESRQPLGKLCASRQRLPALGHLLVFGLEFRIIRVSGTIKRRRCMF